MGDESLSWQLDGSSSFVEDFERSIDCSRGFELDPLYVFSCLDTSSFNLLTCIFNSLIPNPPTRHTDKYRVLLAELYQLSPSNTSAILASNHLSVASTLRSAILDLFWSPSKFAFYDYNLTSSSQNTWFSPATFYPYWSGIFPDEVLSSEENAVKAFSSVRMVMSRYNGTFPASFVQTGLQWDAPKYVFFSDLVWEVCHSYFIRLVLGHRINSSSSKHLRTFLRISP